MLKAAGAAVALPFLEAMAPHALASPSTFKPWPKSPAAHPRAIFCYVPNGVNIIQWVPTTTGVNYTLSPTLETLKELRHDFSILSGLSHPNAFDGHHGADVWLTAADVKAKPGCDYTNTISVDQILADVHGKATRFPSVQLSDLSGTGAAGHSHTLSFDRKGTPLPAEESPRRVFERLFVPDTAGDRTATIRRYAEDRSILDEVASEARALERKLGAADRRKLDEYLSSVRQTETQVKRLEGWVNVPKKKVDPTGLQLNGQPHNAHDRGLWIDVMLELSYLAFITDTTRVITYEWSREAGGLGGNGEDHHHLSHHEGLPANLAKLAEIDRFHLGRLARFMKLLKATREESDTMLDHTIIMLGSGMNSGAERGDHSKKNLPLLVAGGGKLGLKHNQHLAFNPDKAPPLSNVLLTILQHAGVATDKFADATGTLTGLV
jgi:hypothetical protein